MRKEILFFIFIMGLYTVLQACSGGEELERPQPVSDHHTARTALDYYGVYKGIVPCASCEGIDTRITLSEGNRYTLESRYIGESDSIFIQAGVFEWMDDNSRIRLSQEQPDSFSPYYFVAEGRLIQLDLEGNRIEGEMAGAYQLQQVATDPVFPPLTDQEWTLTRLYDREEDSRERERHPGLQFEASMQRVFGSGGCNRFNGSFSLNGPEISFINIASTKMACPDPQMELEQMFFNALNNTRQFQVNPQEQTLRLFDENGEEIAQFDAVR
ncbi:MAG: META domain-containing protein [Balneolaceae bacterium]